MKKEFWKNWKNKTRVEKEAIKSLTIGEKIILDNILKSEILAIYVKGSFVRREMKKGSDLDIITILKTSKYLPKIKALDEKYKKIHKQRIQLGAYSLYQLKTGKKIKCNPGQSDPGRFIKHLPHYGLVYGKPFNISELYHRSDKSCLEGMIKVFETSFIPDYKKGKMYFSELVKQVFWLEENAQKMRGKNPSHSWKALAKSSKETNSLINNAWKFRVKKPKDKKIRNNFVKKLGKYLSGLKREFDIK